MLSKYKKQNKYYLFLYKILLYVLDILFDLLNVVEISILIKLINTNEFSKIILFVILIK